MTTTDTNTDTTMKTHECVQGSPEWLALRRDYFTASEAPAMMGCSPYQTRTELLQAKLTGLTPQVDGPTQIRFDDGHRAEAAFRPAAEREIGDDLYPVTGSRDIDGLPLLASFDGLTMDYTTGFEHKLYSHARAAALIDLAEPAIYDCWQMEQQLLVSGANVMLYAISNPDDPDESEIWWYKSKPERRAALIAGWKQFAADLADLRDNPASTTPSAAPAPQGRAPETLPALRIELQGIVTSSNLLEFKARALQVIGNVNRHLATDQDFADAEKSVKWCADVESRLKAAKDHATSQAASIEELFRTIDDISAEAKRVRLDLEKLVKQRKDAIRADIVIDAVKRFEEHKIELGKSLPANGGDHHILAVRADFQSATKGLRTIDSLKNAVDTELARAKIEASNLATAIQIAHKIIADVSAETGLIVHDKAALVIKQPDDLRNVLAVRVAAETAARAAAAAQVAAAQEAAKAEAAAVVNNQPEPVQVQPVQVQPAPAAMQSSEAADYDTGRRLRIGELNTLLHPVSIDAAGLSSLGFNPVAQDKNAKLYRAADVPAICRALMRHLETVAKSVF